ncbi:uncharacterized protein J4E84_003582 [Alternaria hordeiaustralica]|uniref:uncharacterized protein n=1 Tax=Alternaria hordeiaustralica TaxID=1187925 RepID=UPI0020C31D6C|nr:uncharacterized protein J4E84_003582 [Alternaria hordeiaustralica]KAI4691291.1 hypothetical protein J4E84_003582 [Alternaria hordeiaustralica]
MAPSTRLRARPDRRVNYAEPSGPIGTRNNPVRIEETPEPEAGSRTSPAPTTSGRKRGRKLPVRKKTRAISPEAPEASLEKDSKAVARVKAGAVVKPKAEPKTRKKLPIPKEKERPKKQECSICATIKDTSRSFKVPNDACEHLQTICNLCVAKMLKTKVADRQLKDAELSCPVHECDYSLDYAALQAIVSKAAFEDYDKAVTKHALSSGESYIPCLSAKCGRYFSIEDCKNTKSSKQRVACPYCEHEICLKCNRPWTSHGKGGCDQAKKAEDDLSKRAVKTMGAKPCPKCGMNIQKHGGCDHMTCEQCGHNFCWVCLVEYTKDIRHRDDCPHARVHVAVDPGNWLPEDLTLAQINRLIAEADARLDAPVEAPAHAHVNVPHVAPAPQAPAPAPPPLAVAFGGMLNPLNWRGGGGGGGANAGAGANRHPPARDHERRRRDDEF